MDLIVTEMKLYYGYLEGLEKTTCYTYNGQIIWDNTSYDLSAFLQKFGPMSRFSTS